MPVGTSAKRGEGGEEQKEEREKEEREQKEKKKRRKRRGERRKNFASIEHKGIRFRSESRDNRKKRELLKQYEESVKGKN